jgi:SPX domain protein involved in polyphosphate accumulation
MKFGRHLKTSLVREYQYQYFDYDAVKKEVSPTVMRSLMWQIKKGTTNGRKWREDDEAAFVSLLEAELDKVHTFQKV